MHSKTHIHTPNSKHSQRLCICNTHALINMQKLTHIHTHGKTHASTCMYQQTGKTTSLQHSFINKPETTCTHSDTCTNTHAPTRTHQHAHHNKHAPKITHQKSRNNTHQHARTNKHQPHEPTKLLTSTCMHSPTCTHETTCRHIHTFTNNECSNTYATTCTNQQAHTDMHTAT